MTAGRRVLIVAGEASGDRHAAGLMREALAREPGLSFAGIGGAEMRAAGLKAVFDADSIAVVGFLEVIRHLPKLRRAYRECLRLLDQGVNAVLLVDYPGFNLRLASEARRRGIPVLYYISPQVWAWKPGRLDRIARDVDRMLVVFPFEVELYERRGVPVTYVGHPLLDSLEEEEPAESVARGLGLDPARPVIGVLPGSRPSEVRRHAAPALGACRLLRERLPGLQVVIPRAPALPERLLQEALEPYPDLGAVVAGGPLRSVLPACRAAIVASGTATLETGLMGIPMVVIYRLNRLTAAMARRLAVTDTFGLVNIVAGRRVVPECIQERCTAERIARKTEAYLADAELHEATVTELRKVRARLGEPGAGARAAEALLDFLRTPSR